MRTKGLSLVEIIIAIAILSVVVLAVASVISNGLNISRENHYNVAANSFAQAAIEEYRSFLSDPINYATLYTDPSTLPNLSALQAKLPAGFATPSISVIPTDIDGSTYPAAQPTPPPLFRLSVVLQKDGRERANIITQIGNPDPAQ